MGLLLPCSFPSIKAKAFSSLAEGTGRGGWENSKAVAWWEGGGQSRVWLLLS